MCKCGEGKTKMLHLKTYYLVGCTSCGAEVISKNEIEAITLWNDFQSLRNCRFCGRPPHISSPEWCADRKWNVYCWKDKQNTFSASERHDAVAAWNQAQEAA